MAGASVVGAPTDIEYERVSACPACGAESSRKWRTKCPDTSHTVERTFSYLRCSKCSATYLEARPTPASVGRFYADDYAPYAGSHSADPSLGVANLADRTNSPVGKLHRQLLDTYTPSREGARLLDFGCGSPAVLAAARGRGFDTVGADFSERVVAAVAGAGHTAMVVGSPEWEALAPGSFDVVRINHVIEHLYEPRATLTRLFELLRVGGRLHIATPNPAGVSARLFGRHWFSLEAPRHIVLLPPETARRMTMDCGAKNADLVYEHVTKDITRSLSYFARRGLRLADNWSGDGSPLINRALWPLARAVAHSGHADRYHVFAVK